LKDRNVGFHSEQHKYRIGRRVRQADAVDFFNLLTGPELLEMTEEHSPEHRERLYPPTVTLSMFIKQSLVADRSCQRAVNAWAGQRSAEGLSVQSIRTGGYCGAALQAQHVAAHDRSADVVERMDEEVVVEALGTTLSTRHLGEELGDQCPLHQAQAVFTEGRIERLALCRGEAVQRDGDTTCNEFGQAGSLN
jgi:hypothetical protein